MSYSALIIEDNSLAVEALKQTIPWDELRIQLLGTASNGREGLKLIREHRPDIIISDIHMPELDGLEMIGQLHDEFSDCRVIFITAYQRIDYASRAIKLSAFDFILKPIDNDELYDALQRATLSIQHDRDAKASDQQLREVTERSQLLIALSHGIRSDAKDGLSLFHDEQINAYCILVASCKNGLSGPVIWRLDALETTNSIKLVSAVIDDELVLFCGFRNPTSDHRGEVTRIAQQLMNGNREMVVAASAVHYSLDEFRTSYDEALQALLFHHIYSTHMPISFFDDPHDARTRGTRLMDIEQLCSKLAQNFHNLDAEQIWAVVKEKSGGRPRLIKTMLMFFCTGVMRDRAAGSRWADTIDMTVYNLTKIENEQDAYQWLVSFYDEIRGASTVTTSLVRDVLEYINQHITEGLLLEEVSAHFFVSPNYLSSLIRKETGITYRQHVISAKMEVAKRMLGDTRMRVEDIAHAVGYENYISFYNIFKKVEHVNPTEYRLGKRGGA